jgi:hypothetical protein
MGFILLSPSSSFPFFFEFFALNSFVLDNLLLSWLLSLQIMQEFIVILSFESTRVYCYFFWFYCWKITMAKHDKVMIFEGVSGVDDNFCGLVEIW